MKKDRRKKLKVVRVVVPVHWQLDDRHAVVTSATGRADRIVFRTQLDEQKRADVYRKRPEPGRRVSSYLRWLSQRQSVVVNAAKLH